MSDMRRSLLRPGAAIRISDLLRAHGIPTLAHLTPDKLNVLCDSLGEMGLEEEGGGEEEERRYKTQVIGWCQQNLPAEMRARTGDVPAGEGGWRGLVERSMKREDNAAASMKREEDTAVVAVAVAATGQSPSQSCSFAAGGMSERGSAGDEEEKEDEEDEGNEEDESEEEEEEEDDGGTKELEALPEQLVQVMKAVLEGEFARAVAGLAVARQLIARIQESGGGRVGE